MSYEIIGQINDPIIEVKNVSFFYNHNPALNKLNFIVERNKFISILGPNGAGKTTLVKLLSKIILPTEGEILIDGKNIKNLNYNEIAKKIAVVPQSTSIGFDFSVYETVLMGRYPYLNRFQGEKLEDFEIVENIMKLTHTYELKDKKYNELSGGEQQRVIIAQTLVQNCPIIILDEPTSHLDINYQIEFMEFFNSLHKTQTKTIIGIFHDINLAIQYSEKILFLKDGSIFSYGDVNDVLNRKNIMSVFKSDVYIGKNPFTGKLYVSPNFNITNNLVKEKGEKNLKIHVIAGGGSASQILNILYNAGYSITTGVINNLDTDLYTAQQLGITFVDEAPFSPISEEAYKKNIELIKKCDVVILPCLEYGNGNYLNLVAVSEALKLNKKIIIIECNDIKNRDHTGGKAISLYEKIKLKKVNIIKNNSDILNLLQVIFNN